MAMLFWRTTAKGRGGSGTAPRGADECRPRGPQGRHLLARADARPPCAGVFRTDPRTLKLEVRQQFRRKSVLIIIDWEDWLRGTRALLKNGPFRMAKVQPKGSRSWFLS